MQLDSLTLKKRIRDRIQFKKNDAAWPCISLKSEITGLEEALAIISRFCEDGGNGL